MSDGDERRGITSGRNDDGCCGPKNPCGPLLWTPFNILVALGTLYFLASLAMDIPETSGIRMMGLSAWMWWWIAGACFFLVTEVLFIIFHAVKMPVQGQLKPEPHQYWPSHGMACTGLLFSFIVMMFTILQHQRVENPTFDRLNNVNVDTADVIFEAAGVRWAFHALMGTMFSVLYVLGAIFVYLPGEKHPILKGLGKGGSSGI